MATCFDVRKAALLQVSQFLSVEGKFIGTFYILKSTFIDIYGDRNTRNKKHHKVLPVRAPRLNTKSISQTSSMASWLFFAYLDNGNISFVQNGPHNGPYLISGKQISGLLWSVM